MARMEDLTHGARVLHPNWNQTGTVVVVGGEVFVHWDIADPGIDSPVYEGGVTADGHLGLDLVFLEVIGEGTA